MNHKKLVIFCDFDGTITETDNIIEILKHFNPSGWRVILDKMIDKKLSIRQGLEQFLSLFPSSLFGEIVQFTLDQAKIRVGFESFVQYCSDNNIKLLVTSGGLDFIIYPMLAPFPIHKDQIYCNLGSLSGEQMQITFPHPCDELCSHDCGMCKSSIIRSFDPEKYTRILIGDSITDFAGAEVADYVFACSHLAELCKERDYNFHPFETFHEVVEKLHSF